MTECLFCDMGSDKMPVDKLHDDDRVFAIRDIHPRAPVHFMVIPKEHIPSAVDIGQEHGSLLAHMIQVANRVARSEGTADKGYRLALNVGEYGGQTIYHIHMHVLGGRRLGPEG
ncbi:MAG: HIT domain-containing protein [Dehalococcoidia bacterium]|nr:MAG: HIT domain-containing protein [Dehalococcoidia bacterium]